MEPKYHPETRFWNKMPHYKINPEWTLTGYSEAARYTGFWIPEKRIMLDCGVPSMYSPEYIFITHGHLDHTHELPRSLIDTGSVVPTVIVPKPHESKIVNFIKSAYNMTKYKENYEPKNKVISVVPDTTIDLTIKSKPYKIEIIKCTHSVPCDGYGFIEIRRKLKPELADLPQSELKTLIKSKIEITDQVEVPILLYLGDTDHRILTDPKLVKYRTIIIECTFLDPDHIKESAKTKHMHWSNLEPYIRSHPEITFILIHFSSRYTDEYKTKFFKSVDLTNIHPWF
jgi:ribonuclease Z